MEAAMKAFGRVLTFGILLLSFGADAHDPSMPHHEWFNKQEMNPAARQRLGVPWKSCCDNGDVFKTRFRVGEDRSDQWQYLKDGEWKTIPPDIIKEGDTPDHTPVLFINKYTGVELCFFVPLGGL
jgi:hypothetical protein